MQSATNLPCISQATTGRFYKGKIYFTSKCPRLSVGLRQVFKRRHALGTVEGA